MTPVLQMRDVRRDYGNGPAQVVALDGVSIEIAPGELVAVMGPSGSGKSTLLNLAGGLDEATSGQIVVAGVDLAGLNDGHVYFLGSSLMRVKRICTRVMAATIRKITVEMAEARPNCWPESWKAMRQV